MPMISKASSTNEEHMSLLLSSFDQIYEDFKSGMNEMNVFRSRSNVETSRREALEISNKTLKEENERLKKLYCEVMLTFLRQPAENERLQIHLEHMTSRSIVRKC